MSVKYLRSIRLSNLLNPRGFPEIPSSIHSFQFTLSAFLFAALSSGVSIMMSPSAQAATLINNGGVQFEQDTTLEADFVESNGAYQSVFGVINLDTKEKTPLLIETKSADDPDTIFRPSSKVPNLGIPGDFRGTPGNAVQQATGSYNFKAGNRYVFYLESSYNGRPTGILYSTNTFNPNQEQQAEFAGSPTELCTTGMMVAWDDTGSRLVRNRQQQDRDFDDFVVKMRQSTCAIGGGEPPPEVAQIPPAPPVAAIPAVGARRGGEWGLLALLAPLAFLGGGGDSDNGTTGVGNSSINPPSGVDDSSINPPGGVIPGGGGGGNPKTPIPEPMTILGSGVAVGAAGLFQRRRNQRKQNRK